MLHVAQVRSLPLYVVSFCSDLSRVRETAVKRWLSPEALLQTS